MLEFLSLLYAGVGLMGVAGFIPQIIKLATATGQSKAISLQTWSIWSFSGIVSLSYAIFILGDSMAIAVTAGNCTGTIAVLSLASYNRFIRFRDEEIVIVHKPKKQTPEQQDRRELGGVQQPLAG